MGVLRPLHCDEGLLAKTEDDLPVVGGRTPNPGDVDVAGVGDEPGKWCDHAGNASVHWVFVVVADSADAHLAQIVPAGPGEVADQMGMGADDRPVSAQVGHIGLGADDHPVGIQLVIQEIAVGDVVVTHHIKRGRYLLDALCDDRIPHDLVFHHGPHGHLGVHPLRFGLFGGWRLDLFG